MDRKALHELLDRYTTGECSAEERQLVEHWYELVGETRDFSMREEDWLVIENRIWEQLRPGKQPHSETNVKPLWGRIAKTLAGVAAAALIVMGLYWYKTSVPASEHNALLVAKEEQTEWKIFENTTGKPKLIRLPDGSAITLEPDSRLAVSAGFNKSNREVRLLGLAAFDVARNPAVPFMLYCGDMITKVLGTRFIVNARSTAEPMEVTVQSGKVTVYRNNAEAEHTTSANNGVILTPNQKATYYPDHHQFVASITDNPLPVAAQADAAPRGYSFVFEETPLSEITRQLQLTYGIEIELEQESIADCPFTGNLSNQDLYSKLELLCGSVNGTYEVRGTKILLMGKGCQ